MAHIEGATFFERVTFQGDADFQSMRIGSNVNFNGVTFQGEARFGGMQIEGDAGFSGTSFGGEADFSGARIGSGAYFDGATFQAQTSFINTWIGSNTFFAGAKFQDHVTFQASEFKLDTFFVVTRFAKDVDFRNTSFNSIFFAPHLFFEGAVDLRGCLYDRIDPPSVWKGLLGRLTPYDRQPYTQLEGTFRKAGEDKLANSVYYERKRLESTRISPWNVPAKGLDWLLWGLTGYGVQLGWLLGWIAAFLVMGTLIFRLSGAVESRQPSSASPLVGRQTPPERDRVGLPLLDHLGVPLRQPARDVTPQLSWAEAFWVSVRSFLPVEIPAGEHWKPSTRSIRESHRLWGPWGLVLRGRFITWATVLKVAGWVLVPIGVAGLTGLLKR
jgi:hypothetical protein